ncbi:hypothetical protein ACP70R_009685 [Stipagrostis hirtigluma subsp. patula]
MVLDAGSLSELSWSVVNSAWTLELRTPSLRVLHMEDYWISKLTISAPRLEELMFLESRFRVHCTFYPNHGIDFLSDHLDYWKSHEINLAHLQEVEYTGLVGTDCDIKFLEFLLSSATQPRQASVSFDQKSELMGNRSNFFELTPRVGNRVWTAFPDAHLTYRWKDCLRDTAVELTNLGTVT